MIKWGSPLAAELLRLARASCQHRICFVCREPIPERDGCYDSSLGILTHVGRCSALVERDRKDYSRSKRGRYRRRIDVLNSAYVAWSDTDPDLDSSCGE